jgi:hypothetical protein
VFALILFMIAISFAANSNDSTPSTQSTTEISATQPTLSPEQQRAQEEPWVREEQRRRAEEAARLDRTTYQAIAPRDFALLVKNPDAYVGQKFVVYGAVTQFDSATGPSTFRGNTGAVPQADWYDYDQNTIIQARDPAILTDVVEDDMVTMYVEVGGSYTYETQIGGSTTVPLLYVNIIDVTGSDAIG